MSTRKRKIVDGSILTPRRKQMRAALKSMQHYVGTYHEQAHYDDYTNTTYVDDMLYGLGLSIQNLFAGDFKGPGGYERFKQYLREHLATHQESPPPPSREAV